MRPAGNWLATVSYLANKSTHLWLTQDLNPAVYGPGATTGNTAAAWTNSATLPTWSSQADATYTVQATATDKAGNTLAGTAVTFTLDKTTRRALLQTSQGNYQLSVDETAQLPNAAADFKADGSIKVEAGTLKRLISNCLSCRLICFS